MSFFRPLVRPYLFQANRWARYMAGVPLIEPPVQACYTSLFHDILKIEGEDTPKFLQGLISNDIHVLEKGKSLYTTWLSPKGRFLFDSFIYQLNNASSLTKSPVFVQCQKGAGDDLMKHINRHKLKSKVSIEDVSNQFQLFGLLHMKEEVLHELLHQNRRDKEGVSFIDPRTPSMGVKLVVPKNSKPNIPKNFVHVSSEYYETFRFLHGVPTYPHDLQHDKTLPLEANLDWLQGISYEKGCYVGQELVARTHFQGQIRKRIIPFYITPSTLHQLPISLSPLPRVNNYAMEDHGLLSYSFLRTTSSQDQTISIAPGSEIQLDGKSVGKVLSVDSHSNLGFALLRTEEAEGKHDPKKHDYRVEGVPAHSSKSLDTTEPLEKALIVDKEIRVHPFIPSWWP